MPGQGQTELTKRPAPARTASVPVLINRAGGAVRRDCEIGRRIGDALAEAGINGAIEEIDGDRIADRCAALAEGGADLVIVGGGDGSISAAASALTGTATRLAILPLGTLNHFARDLKIPADPGGAARIIAAGRERRVDLAEMNGRIFINNSAIGLYPLMVIDRDWQRKRLGRSKRLALVVASLRTLARFGHQRLTLTVNRERARVDTPLLFVGNNDYQLDFPASGRRESLEDGELCVLVMRKKTRRSFIAATARALLGRTREDDMVRIAGVERLRVASRRSRLAVSLDGEVVEVKPPLDYRIRKQALRVIAP